MIIDGRAIAKEVIARTHARAASLAPSFVAFVVAPNAATRSYLAIKGRQASEAGIRMRVEELPESISTEALIARIEEVDDDALIVQLPLPEQVDLMAVLERIPVGKDADVLSPVTRESGSLMHPIAASVQDLLERSALSPSGKQVAVVGQGWLVGQPVAAWLRSEGALVTTVTLEAGNLEEACQAADIIVTGAGVPGLITPELVREGAAVIDVGTSELGGSLAGDVAPEVAKTAGLFTPVPGGVGPIAVAYLMENVAILAERRRLHTS